MRNVFWCLILSLLVLITCFLLLIPMHAQHVNMQTQIGNTCGSGTFPKSNSGGTNLNCSDMSEQSNGDNFGNGQSGWILNLGDGAHAGTYGFFWNLTSGDYRELETNTNGGIPLVYTTGSGNVGERFDDTGGLGLKEGPCTNKSSSYDWICGDSTNHRLATINNNGSENILVGNADFPTCADTGGNHLNFSGSTFSCGNSSSGGGGNVSGPGSSTSGDIATWNGTSGTTLQDSGWNIIGSSLIGGISGTLFSTQGTTVTNPFLFEATGNLTKSTGAQNFILSTATFGSTSTSSTNNFLYLEPTFSLVTPGVSAKQSVLTISPTVNDVTTFYDIYEPIGTINVDSTNYNNLQYLNEIEPSTFTAGSAVTIVRAATLHVSGAPSAGSNVTLNNPYAIYIDSGNVDVATGFSYSAGMASVGTKFTASGCTNSTTVGGATAGSYHSGTTGTCTVTITMGNSLSAPNGWDCTANDQTTPADKQQTISGGSQTTAVLSGTTASGDVISFHCIGY